MAKKLRTSFYNLRSKTLYRVLFDLIILAFGSLMLTFFIFQTYYGGFSLERFEWFFQPEHNRIFAISCLIISLVNLLLFGLLFNPILATASLAVISAIWLFVNQAKIASRQVPFLPEDLFMASEAGQMTVMVPADYLEELLINLSLILMASVSALFIRHLVADYTKTKLRYRLALGLTMVICSLYGLISISQTIKDPNMLKSKDNFIGNDLVAWNQQINYFWNGPVIGFVYNLGKIKLEPPNNYSETSIQKIVQKYQSQLAQFNQNRLTPDDQPINLVMILSESLVDPLVIDQYYPLKRNPMPFLTELMQKTPSGRLATSEYGGGTANVEFEILTGFSTTLNQNTTPFANFLPKPDMQNFPSIANHLKNYNYQTLALHNYSPLMYKRNLTYPNLGFDEFKGIDAFKHAQTLEQNPYDSDFSFFKTLLEELDKNPTQVKFINGVTMQNHSPYQNLYALNPQDSFTEPADLSEEAYHKLETYLRGLSYSDVALEDFYSQLQNLTQKTLVVFYGDHFPGSEVLERVSQADAAQARLTPVFTMANFDLESSQLGTISGNYLSNAIFKLLNWKTSAFALLLNELNSQFPKLSFYHVNDPDDFERSQTYQDYRLIQYDMLNGQRFSQKLGFFDAK